MVDMVFAALPKGASFATLDVMMHIKASLLLQQQLWVPGWPLGIPDAPWPIRLNDQSYGNDGGSGCLAA